MIPTRRTTAEAFQILVCHVLGDATSPFVIGLVTFSIHFTRRTSLRVSSFIDFRCHSTHRRLFIRDLPEFQIPRIRSLRCPLHRSGGRTVILGQLLVPGGRSCQSQPGHRRRYARPDRPLLVLFCFFLVLSTSYLRWTLSPPLFSWGTSLWAFLHASLPIILPGHIPVAHMT